MSRLTASDVMNVGFHKANIGGYRSDEVDVFIDKVQETFQEQNKEIENLKKKLVVLAKRIEQYRTDEDNVKTALISAQKLADIALKDAEKKAEVLVKEAEEKADSFKRQVDEKIDSKKDEIIKLQTEAAKFKADLMDVYKKHLLSIKAIPDGDSEHLNLAIDAIKADIDTTKKRDKENAKKVEFEDFKTDAQVEESKEESNENIVSDSGSSEQAVEQETKHIDIDSIKSKSNMASNLDDDFWLDSRETKTFKAIKFGEDYDIEEDNVFDDIELG